MKVRILILALVVLFSLTVVSNGWAPGPKTYKVQSVGS